MVKNTFALRDGVKYPVKPDNVQIINVFFNKNRAVRRSSKGRYTWDTCINARLQDIQAFGLITSTVLPFQNAVIVKNTFALRMV